jgi:hypothetical protein
MSMQYVTPNPFFCVPDVLHLVLLAGQKTQARALVTPQPEYAGDEWHWNEISSENKIGALGCYPDLDEFKAALLNFCPFGQAGRVVPVIPASAKNEKVEIVGIRVERLHNMTETDARAEGVEPLMLVTGKFAAPARKWKNYLGQAYCDGMNMNSAYESYQTLWTSFYGEQSWAANPWVWVVVFKLKGGLQQ